MKTKTELIKSNLHFLVRVKSWQEMPHHGRKRKVTLAYLSSSSKRVVRILKVSNQAFLTIEGEKNNCRETNKWTFEIPVEEVDEMLHQTKLFGEAAFPVIKTRYRFKDPEAQWRNTPLIWNVDVFDGRNKGLILADLKFEGLDSTDEKCKFEAYVRAHLPTWIGKELDFEKDESFRRYFSYSLSQIPFSCWPNPWKKDMLEHLGL